MELTILIQIFQSKFLFMISFIIVKNLKLINYSLTRGDLAIFILKIKQFYQFFIVNPKSKK